MRKLFLIWAIIIANSFYAQAQFLGGNADGYDKGAVSSPFNLISAPTVTTSALSGTTTSSATVGGNVTDDGGETVTDRGVLWDTSPITGASATTSEGSGTGTFSVVKSGLSVNTRYYYQAYADNSVGAGVGAELNFYTLANAPGAASASNPATTTMDVSIDANGNPAHTEYAIHETSTGDFVQDDGTLGASASWSTEADWETDAGNTAKTVNGLSVNTQYTFEIKARNGDGTETAYGASSSSYTLANAPGAPTVNNPSATTLDVTLDVNGNPAGTLFAIQEDGGQYVQSDGTLGASASWSTNADWGTKTVTGLTPNTIYIFSAKARNGDGTETAPSSTASDRTLAATPAAPTVNNPTANTLDVTVNANGNPASAEFVIHETTTNQYVQGDGSLGVGEVWQTKSAWGTKTVTGLTLNQTYTFEVKARNGDGVETAYGTTTDGTTREINEAWVNPSYCNGCDNDGHTWGVDAFADLASATATVNSNATIHVSGVNVNDDVNTDDFQFVIGDGDMSIGGNAEVSGSGFIQIEGEGYLERKTGISSPAIFPIGLGSHNCTVTISWSGGPINYLKARVKAAPDNEGLLGYVWQFEGPDNLNATIEIRLPKAALPNGKLPPQFELKNKESDDSWKLFGNTTITEADDYYIITITNVNKF